MNSVNWLETENAVQVRAFIAGRGTALIVLTEDINRQIDVSVSVTWNQSYKALPNELFTEFTYEMPTDYVWVLKDLMDGTTLVPAINTILFRYTGDFGLAL